MRSWPAASADLVMSQNITGLAAVARCANLRLFRITQAGGSWCIDSVPIGQLVAGGKGAKNLQSTLRQLPLLEIWWG